MSGVREAAGLRRDAPSWQERVIAGRVAQVRPIGRRHGGPDPHVHVEEQQARLHLVLLAPSEASVAALLLVVDRGRRYGPRLARVGYVGHLAAPPGPGRE